MPYRVLEIALRPIEVDPLQSAGTWLADVYFEEQPVSSNVQLTNPFSTHQEERCTWYLEVFVKSPFETKKAKDVEIELLIYAQTLHRELHLSEVYPLLEAADATSSVDLRIDIVELEEPKDSSSVYVDVHGLHWELLELQSLWPGNIRSVAVRRLSQSANPELRAQKVNSWKNKNISLEKINVLLVIARNLSGDVPFDDDVDPFLMLRILLNIKRQLQHLDIAMFLNIEVVRPGTWAALKEHLDNVTKINGPGFYHLVHFDLHGQVVDLGNPEEKLSFVLFASSTSDRLSRVKADRVAKLLNEHKIPSAVLNACESAKSSRGEDSNLAKVFVRHGISNVLAMSFKLLEHGAKIFLKTFYTSFLLQGQSFALAAYHARSILREDATRNARLNLNREIWDWIIPVVFTRGEDLHLVPPSTASDKIKSLSASALPSATMDHIDQVVGRDFDALRFERDLIKNRFLAINGHAGVGKTSFIHYLASIWKESGFVDIVYYVDLKAKPFKSSSQIFKALLETENNNFLDSSLPNDLSEQVEWTAARIRARRSVVVIDSMERSHSAFSDKIIPEQLSAADITRLDALIMELAGLPYQTLSPFIILISRLAAPKDWPSRSKVLKGFTAYQLQNLVFDDAKRFAMSNLVSNGVNISTWKHADEAQLDLLLALSDRNPAMLEAIFALGNAAKIPWKETFAQILYGKISQHPEAWSTINASPYHSSFASGFISIADYISDAWLEFWVFFCLFWKQGPPGGIIKLAMEELGMLGDFKKLGLNLLLLISQGYITVDEAEVDIIWIHPLWTLAARVYFCRAEEYNKDSSILQQLPKVFAQTLSWLDHRMPSGQRLLSRRRSLRDILARRSASIDSASRKFLSPFLRFFAESETRGFFKTVIKGLDIETFGTDYRLSIYNTYSIAHYCSDSWYGIAKDDWPLSSLATATAHARRYLSAAEAAFYAAVYEKLIWEFFERNGSIAIDGKDITSILAMTNFLTAIHRSEISQLQNREAQFSVLSLAIVEASEQKYGSLPDDHAQFQKSVAFRERAVTLLEEGNITEADSFWQKSADLDKEIFSSDERSDTTASKRILLPVYDEYIASVVPDLLTRAEVKKKALSYGSVKYDPVLRAWYDLRRNQWGLIKRLAISGHSSSRKDILAALDDMSHLSKQQFDNLHTVSADRGIFGLDKDSRWWTGRIDSHRDIISSDSPSSRLMPLERAQLSGRWRDASAEHLSLMVEALIEGDLSQAHEHSTSLLEIGRKQDLSPAKMDQYRQLEDTMITGQSLQTLESQLNTRLESGLLDMAQESGQRLKNALAHWSILGNGSEELIKTMSENIDLKIENSRRGLPSITPIATIEKSRELKQKYDVATPDGRKQYEKSWFEICKGENAALLARQHQRELASNQDSIPETIQWNKDMESLEQLMNSGKFEDALRVCKELDSLMESGKLAILDAAQFQEVALVYKERKLRILAAQAMASGDYDEGINTSTHALMILDDPTFDIFPRSHQQYWEGLRETFELFLYSYRFHKAQDALRLDEATENLEKMEEINQALSVRSTDNNFASTGFDATSLLHCRLGLASQRAMLSTLGPDAGKNMILQLRSMKGYVDAETADKARREGKHPQLFFGNNFTSHV